MSNRLKDQTSPYLLQHAENPVDWFPWGAEAFEKAKNEDKPVFLSVGYSTCHWCHVMARESFEDAEAAELLNRYFVAVKADKEERPDVDSVYMEFCQAFTGGGGWPMSVFMTPEQKPFFAGTYFPKTSRGGSVGLMELLAAIHDKWENDRESLLESADGIVREVSAKKTAPARPDEALLNRALGLYRRSFDSRYGGFGGAPKFPSPHNLLFLMRQYKKRGDKELLDMAEKTLTKLYRGGIFDHIGGGLCRYSTDRRYLIPHFEKMLYDNALLITACCKAFELTGKRLYEYVAERTAAYVLTEMTSGEGGFFSAQDADSDGEEGKYYVFTPREIRDVLGEKDGGAFCLRYGVAEEGNFEGKSIPNLLPEKDLDESYDKYMPRLREYRRRRASLHRDDKILTFWNSLMISALCSLYRVSRDASYLRAAKRARDFIEERLCEGDALFVSWRDGRRGGRGYLDDYAGYIHALTALYEATFEREYLDRARRLTAKAAAEYFDGENGGFFLYGAENETLITRPKESYDGALPSGNSLMTYNLVRLSLLAPEEKTEKLLQKQLSYMAGEAKGYPNGFAMFLIALSDWLEPPASVTVVRGSGGLGELPFYTPSDAALRVLDAPEGGYETLNGETAFYVCKDHTCLPPVNEAGFRESAGGL